MRRMMMTCLARGLRTLIFRYGEPTPLKRQPRQGSDKLLPARLREQAERWEQKVTDAARSRSAAAGTKRKSEIKSFTERIREATEEQTAAIGHSVINVESSTEPQSVPSCRPHQGLAQGCESSNTAFAGGSTQGTGYDHSKGMQTDPTGRPETRNPGETT